MSELKATQKGMWKNAYDILLDGNLLTKWDAKTWSVGGTFVLDEHSYEVKANGMATRYEMTDATKGARAATASRLGGNTGASKLTGRLISSSGRPSGVWKNA